MKTLEKLNLQHVALQSSAEHMLFKSLEHQLKDFIKRTYTPPRKEISNKTPKRLKRISMIGSSAVTIVATIELMFRKGFDPHLLWIIPASYLFWFMLITTISSLCLIGYYFLKPKPELTLTHIDQLSKDSEVQIKFLKKDYQKSIVSIIKTLKESQEKLHVQIEEHEKDLHQLKTYKDLIDEDKIAVLKEKITGTVTELKSKVSDTHDSIVKMGNLVNDIKDTSGSIKEILTEQQRIVDAKKLVSKLEYRLTESIEIKAEIDILNNIFVNHVKQISQQNIPQLLTNVEVSNVIGKTQLNM